MSPHILEETIDRFLAGEAGVDEATALRAHLASCAECSAQWGGTLKAHAALSFRLDTPSTALAASAARRALASPQRRRWSTWALRAALLFAGLGLGAFIGRQWQRPETTSSTLPRYLFMFSGSQSQSMAVEEIAAIGRDFRAWTDSLVATRQVVAHGQLRRGTLGLLAAAEPGLDSATVRALGAMEGMLLVHAPDDAVAVSLARTCPFLRYGGTIVVRRLAAASGEASPGAVLRGPTTQIPERL